MKRLGRFADNLMTFAVIAFVSWVTWLFVCALAGWPPCGFLLSMWEWVR